MKKQIIKMVSAAVAVCMLIPGRAVFAKTNYDASELFAYYDFETNSTQKFTTYTVGEYVDSGDSHKTALKVSAEKFDNDRMYAEYINVRMDSKNTVISFDFCVQQTNKSFDFIVMDNDAQIIGKVDINPDGTINGATANEKTQMTDYEPDLWYTMDIIADFDEKRTSFYINGKFLGTLAMSSAASEAVNFMYLGVDTTKDGGESMMLDNVSLLYSDINDGFSLILRDYEFGKKEIYASFSESITPESVKRLNSSELCLINTESGEKISISSVLADNRNIIFKIDKEPERQTEYALALPEGLESVQGKPLFDKYVYIQIGEGSGVPIPDAEIASVDFIDGAGVCDNMSISAVNAGANEIITDPSGREVMKITARQMKKTDCGLEFNITEPKFGDTVIVSYDVMLGQDNVLGFYNYIYDTNNKIINRSLYNAKGRLMTTAIDVYPDYATCMETSNSNDVVPSIQYIKDTWYHIDIVFNTMEKTTDYYVNNSLMTSYKTPASDMGEIKKILISDYGLQTVRYNGKLVEWVSGSGAYIFIDNIKIGTAKASSGKILKTRIIDRNGDEYGPLTDCVTSSATGFDLYFSNDIDENSINSDCISLVGDGENAALDIKGYDKNGRKLSVNINQLLKKGERYEISVKNIKTADGNSIKPYTTAFTVSDYASFDIQDFCLTNQSGERITGAEEAKNAQTISVFINAINSLDEEKAIQVLLCSYQNGELKESCIEKITVAPGQEIRKNVLSLPGGYTEYTAMLLDESNFPMPYTKVITEGAITAENEWTVKINGKLEKTNGGEILVTVSKPDSAGNLDTGVFIGRTTTDEDGRFSIAFQLPENEQTLSGMYPANIFAQNGETMEEKIKFINPIRADKAAYEINTAVSEQNLNGVKNCISGNKAELGIMYGFTVNLPDTADIVYNEIKSQPSLYHGNTENVSKLVQNAAIITAVANRSIDNLLDYNAELKLSSSRISKYLERSYINKQFGQEITSKMAGVQYKTISEFLGRLYENFVLKTVHRHDGIGNASEIIGDFLYDIGLNQKPIESVVAVIAGKEYANYAALNAAILNASSGQNVHAGGSGGTSGGSITVSPTIGQVTETIHLPQNIFIDIQDVAWAQEAIVNLAEKGIINGKSKDEFYPNDLITRAEFAQLVSAGMLEDNGIIDPGFGDVTVNDWYFNGVARAYSCGIIHGYSNTYFGAGENITRQDMAVMIYRALGIQDEEGLQNSEFQDVDEIADYAKRAVSYLYQKGIISGVEQGVFAPKEYATRAQAAKIIYEALHL